VGVRGVDVLWWVCLTVLVIWWGDGGDRLDWYDFWRACLVDKVGADMPVTNAIKLGFSLRESAEAMLTCLLACLKLPCLLVCLSLSC
jgi:hypothetical protein